MRSFLLCLLLGLVVNTAAVAATTPSDAPKRFYGRVMEEFQHKDYEAALAGFRLFVELHGQSPLTSSALYWIGECEFRLGRFQDAVYSFEQVVTRYPRSQKLASATLKKAMAYDRLGMRAEARILFNRVVVQFPQSPEAGIAKKALRE
jgi:tol-pal system protein YbgF